MTKLLVIVVACLSFVFCALWINLTEGYWFVLKLFYIVLGFVIVDYFFALRKLIRYILLLSIVIITLTVIFFSERRHPIVFFQLHEKTKGVVCQFEIDGEKKLPWTNSNLVYLTIPENGMYLTSSRFIHDFPAVYSRKQGNKIIDVKSKIYDYKIDSIKKVISFRIR